MEDRKKGRPRVVAFGTGGLALAELDALEPAWASYDCRFVTTSDVDVGAYASEPLDLAFVFWHPASIPSCWTAGGLLLSFARVGIPALSIPLGEFVPEGSALAAIPGTIVTRTTGTADMGEVARVLLSFLHRDIVGDRRAAARPMFSSLGAGMVAVGRAPVGQTSALVVELSEMSFSSLAFAYVEAPPSGISEVEGALVELQRRRPVARTLFGGSADILARNDVLVGLLFRSHYGPERLRSLELSACGHSTWEGSDGDR